MSRRTIPAVEETRKILALHDVHTPSYFPISAMQEMQKHAGYKPNSNARPQHKLMAFTSTELPRNIGPNTGATTPSWFRYANIDGPRQNYAPMPLGYQWNVEYYRREDGTLATNPALVKILTPESQPSKKARLNDYARSLAVPKDELTNEGIEDISSDEELYTKDGHVDNINNDDEGEDSFEDNTDFSAPASLRARPAPTDRSSRASSFLSSVLQPPEAPPASVFSAQSTSIMGPLMGTSDSGYGFRSWNKDKRVDSRYTSLSAEPPSAEDDEDDDQEAIHESIELHVSDAETGAEEDLEGEDVASEDESEGENEEGDEDEDDVHDEEKDGNED